MKNAVIFSGAGLSRESGIPTFRDSKEGLWHNHKVEDVADHEAWPKNKSIMLEFYKARWDNVQSVEPNEAHKAIAKLQEKYNVINITQNVDDLLERAGCKHVMHLHGTLGRRKCEWHKSITNLDGDTQYKCDYLADHSEPVKLGDLCPKCGGQLRPDVVWFGEAVDMKDSWIQDLTYVTDVFIVVGTSAQVHPAAGLLFTFKNTPKKYIIDPNPPLRLQSFNRMAGTACEHMPKLVDELLESDN
jgi:NAD-dependent deacetylase